MFLNLTHDWGWSDVLTNPWGCMALKASQLAGLQFDAEELNIAEIAVRGNGCECVFDQGEWLPRKYNYLSYSTQNDNMNCAQLMSLLLMHGDRAGHQVFNDYLADNPPSTGDYWMAFFTHRMADYHGDADYNTGLTDCSRPAGRDSPPRVRELKVARRHLRSNRHFDPR